ncbi:MAG: hypothetical protein KA313_10460 [Pseudarcicella sp.]|nr:hypothetical protein [Pseudarcicella sp.]MBP6411511.1 hypothetical protein [Pseudarcicella sp.]
MLFFILTNSLLAQKKQASTSLPEIKTNGLHSIAISPSIRAFAKADMSDVRIFDTKNKEVPYYFWKSTRNQKFQILDELPIVAKEVLLKISSDFTIENNTQNSIDQIVLNIANTKINKLCNVSGSNDKKQWYGLIDKYKIYASEDNTNTDFYVNIPLPKTNYKYLKLQINDTKSEPINILKIGTYKISTFENNLTTLEPIAIKYKSIPSLNKTQIFIDFKGKQTIENISLEILEPNFYKRNARILAPRFPTNKVNKKENYLELLADFEINSSKSNHFELPSLHEENIVLEIDNEDNQALKIDKIQFSQLPVYMIADLRANEKYQIEAGNWTLNPPNYDIENFKISDISSLPLITHGIVKSKATTGLQQTKNISLWQNQWFLWICIGLTGLIILYFSNSLLKDIKKGTAN